MLMLHRSLDIIHSRIRQSAPRKEVLPFLRRAFPGLGFDERLELGAVLHPRVVGRVFQIGLPVWSVEFVT